MQTTDWDRLDGRPDKLTREAFARQEADRLRVTVEHFLSFHYVEPCDCGSPTCEGWAVTYRLAGRRRNRA